MRRTARPPCGEVDRKRRTTHAQTVRADPLQDRLSIEGIDRVAMAFSEYSVQVTARRSIKPLPRLVPEEVAPLIRAERAIRGGQAICGFLASFRWRSS